MEQKMQFDADYFARQIFHDAFVPNAWHSAQARLLAWTWHSVGRAGAREGGRNGERN
jgi:hypothetical protein